jgi:alpha-glucosidase (family GH31 glycosyl hydrolase)
VFVFCLKTNQGLYPEYAHHHQVWLPSGANQSEIIDYVKEYLAHNISVGATNVDSNWATGVREKEKREKKREVFVSFFFLQFNSFVWRKDRFPDAGGMINTLHSLGVRVIAWATSMIDTDSPNFAFAKSNDYLISKGALMHWWHGNGGLLDFTYPAAMEYWKKVRLGGKQCVL